MNDSPLLVGVDLVDVVRLQQLMTLDSSFLASTWTPAELAYCNGDAQHLAARWAAKEATMKALGAGIGTFSPLEIEVSRGPKGAPLLVLSGGAQIRAQALNVRAWSLALSHESGMAVAFVVAVVGGDRG